MADLVAILGADRVADEGGTPVVTPRDAAEVAELLRAATRDRLAFAVRGGGTKAGWRAAPERCDAVLSTAALAGVVDRQPGDMTLVARGGSRLDDLQAEVTGDASHHQRLMLDAVGGPAATIGGILATNAAGPRRHAFGTPRDIVIGARYVTGDGVAARSGGVVVKNVAGYDVGKLLIGSRGSLAVITEVAVKLHPVPAAIRTVVLRTDDALEAAAFAERIRTAPVTPTALEVRWPEGIVAVRIGSTEAGAAAQVELLRGLGPIEELDSEAGDALLEDQLALPFAGDGAVLGVGVRPTDLPALLGIATDAGGTFAGRAALVAGDVILPDADPARVTRVAAAVEALGGTVQAHRAATIARIPSPGVARVERAVKDALDPVGVLA